VSVTLPVKSGDDVLQADLYGTLPAERAVILVHGSSWDASGWRDIAPLFAARGIPALALNLRGYDGSTGKTDRWEEAGDWSPISDLRAAKTLLRGRGARQIALVGSSMGGYAVLGSSLDGDIECVVSQSAPGSTTPEDLLRRIGGRKLFIGTDGDTVIPHEHVRRAFELVDVPKTLIVFGGKEHSRAMFAAPYGQDVIAAIVDFVARGL
jgi:dienelactone hydrolase